MPERKVETVRARPGTKVDVNRGARMKRHPSGTYVCMYRDDPGVFFDKQLMPVSEEKAAEAGYDLKAEKRARLKLAEKRRALSEIEAKFAALDEEIEAKVDAKLEEEPKPKAFQGRPAVSGPAIPNPDVKIPPKPLNEQQQAALLMGKDAECNKHGELRGTPELVMVHVGRSKYNVLDRKTNQPIVGGAMVTAVEGCDLMLRHHNVT